MNKQISIFDKNKEKLSIKNMDKPALLRDIPFDKIYESARKEASRKKPVFFVHKYFARRITCNFRMMLLGSLLPYEEYIWDYFYDSFNEGVEENFVVLDPFMGGGTTMFESLRLKANVIGSDLQPLSNFVSQALVKKMDVNGVKKAVKELNATVGQDIMKYQKTKCPECGKDADIMYTFHVKKVDSKNSCKEHKFYSNFVLALKKDEFTLVCPECGDVFKHNFKSQGKAVCNCGYVIENPKQGYINHGKFECDKCGESHVISEYSMEEGYPTTTELIAIEYYCPHCSGHDYKKIEKEDIDLYELACKKYEEMKDVLPIPQQEIPVGYNTNQILNHGYKKFNELFNKRQLLELGLLLKAINEYENDDVKFWLQLAFSGMLEMNNMFCRYQANAYKICNIFFNHAYVPITMPVENNVWGSKLGTGNFIKTVNKIIRGKEFCTSIYDISTATKNEKVEVDKCYSDEKVEAIPIKNIQKLDSNHPVMLSQDSRNLSVLSDKSVDLVLTDPPFGANVMYSELIDFFHSWNYMSSLANELGFTTPLSPKKEEIIVNSVQNKTQENYEEGLTSVFIECNRVLKENGFLIFSFHDKSLKSWVSILTSIYRAGFDLVKAYPVHAETRTGAHTSNKNSIALDIMLICKKSNSKENIKLNNTLEEEIVCRAYEKTENIIRRLADINAEITIPDIENIFISEYFSTCYEKNICLLETIRNGIGNIEKCLNELDQYFDRYDISERRSGWWSELYKGKWEM